MRIFKIVILLLLPAILYAQKIEVKPYLKEIKLYVKHIDDTKSKYVESIAEGEIYNEKSEDPIGGWDAYFLKSNKDLVRIKYSRNVKKEGNYLNLYYRKNHLVYAEKIISIFDDINNTTKEFKSHFYFLNGKLIFQNNSNPKYNVSKVLEEEIKVRNLGLK